MLKNDDLAVTHTMGGMIQTEKTRVHPDNLRVYSTKFDHVWRIKVKDDNQKGKLRIKRNTVYNYSFNEEQFKVQEVCNGVIISDWQECDVIIIMQD